MSTRSEGQPSGEQATGSFEWSSTPGYIKADTITASWDKDAWVIYALHGNASQRGYQQFHFRLPAKSESEPIKHQYVSDVPVKDDTPVREPGMVYFYVWNKPTQYGDYEIVSVTMGGFIKLAFNPLSNTFEGSFRYISPRASSHDLEGDGTFRFFLPKP
jgi:hypothetical protein